MKKWFFAALLVAVGVLGCAREGSERASDPAALRFVVKTIAKTPYKPTRSQTVEALESEKQVDQVRVYLFEAESGSLAGTSDDFTAETVEGGRALTASPAWIRAHMGDKLRAYFVANCASAASLKSFDAADAVDRTEAKFLTATTDRAEGLLAAPLPMTGVLEFTAAAGKHEHTVQLKRRVARFDLSNDRAADVAIQRIVIKQAAAAGTLFSGEIAAAKADPFVVDKIPALTAENGYLAQSLFYLYPTWLTQTQIGVVVRVKGGDEQVLPVESDVKILPNTRYRLVLDATNLEFEEPSLRIGIEVVDWDEGEPLKYQPAERLTIGAVAASEGIERQEDGSFVASDAGSIELETWASTREGVKVFFNDTEGSSTGALKVTSNKTETACTRAAVGYHTEIKIECAEPQKDFQTKIVLQDAANQRVTASLNLTAETGNMETWARSNVVWDAAAERLTFAVTPRQNREIPASAQGMRFLWGSLVAISPAGQKFTPGSIVFSPTGRRDYAWAAIPCADQSLPLWINDNKNEDDFADYNGGKGYDEAAGVGDVCRYISARKWVKGDWRLPTAGEWEALKGQGSASWDPGRMTDFEFSDPEGADEAGRRYIHGFYACTAGWFLGAGAVGADDPGRPAHGISISNNGRTRSDQSVDELNRYGYHMSASSRGENLIHCFNSYGGDASLINVNLRFGVAVRCIRNSK